MIVTFGGILVTRIGREESMKDPGNPTHEEKEKMFHAIQHIKVMIQYYENGKVGAYMCLDRIMDYASTWENK